MHDHPDATPKRAIETTTSVRIRRFLKHVLDHSLGAVGLTLAKHYGNLARQHDRLAHRLEDLRHKTDEQLSTAEQSVDYLFSMHFRTYIEEEVLPRAAKVRRPHHDGPVHGKRARTRFFRWNGMSAYQNFILELDAISRINAAMLELGETRHFPLLVDFSIPGRTITLTHVGTTLPELREPILVHEVEAQVLRIQAILEQAGVLYLDMHSSGKNLAVSPDGILNVIDFDMVRTGDIPFGPAVEDMHRRGSGLISLENIRSMLERCPCVTIAAPPALRRHPQPTNGHRSGPQAVQRNGALARNDSVRGLDAGDRPR